MAENQTRTMTYAEAVREAMAQAMTNDERVFLMGEDVGIYGGAFGVENDLIDRFGPERVRDTTISELGFMGVGVGAALTGMRPIVEIQFSDFTAQAMDQIMNQAAKMYFMMGGQQSVPLVIRAPGGSGTGAAAQHSQSLEALFAHIPGLKVVMPSNATDAASLLLAALEDPNPVMILEHKLLYKQSFEVPLEWPKALLGEGRIEREGTDLTIVATSVEVQRAVQAAEQLEQEGFSVEVIDPRTIRPLDTELILGSVKKTGRVLLVQEAAKTGGFMAEVSATITESDAFGHLQAPVKRLCGLDTPIPYNPQLEKGTVPQVEDIVREAKLLIQEW